MSIQRPSTKLFFVCVFLGLVSVFFADSPSWAQEAPRLFAEGEPAQEGTEQNVVRKRRATLDYSVIEALVAEEIEALTLNLFEDLEVFVETERLERVSFSEYSWIGRPVEFPNDQVTLEIDHEGRIIFVTMTVQGQPYTIRHLGEGIYAIRELTGEGLQEAPLEEESATEEGPPIEPGEEREELENFGTRNSLLLPEDHESKEGGKRLEPGRHTKEVIDVLMLYTTQARDSMGGFKNMRMAIRTAFNNANTSYENSGVDMRLRMVSARAVQYDEAQASSLGDILGDLTRDGNTSGDYVNEQRNDYGADIVGLVVGDAKGWCGKAHIMTNVSTGHSDKAYFVVGEGGCLTWNYSFAHEIGHIMGARHDREVDDKDGSPYDYNHGYVNVTGGSSGRVGWRTIMAYDDECDDVNTSNNTWCKRINRWSDPDSTRGGDPMGASGADNVRTLNNTASTVASFKSAPPVISGTVTDLLTGGGLESVEMQGPYGAVTDENGFYDVIVRSGNFKQLSPRKSDYEFTPERASFQSVTSDITQDFDAGIYHQVFGEVYLQSNNDPLSGIEMAGAPTSSTLTTDQNGKYSFEVLQGWSGTITPQSDKYDFLPKSSTYSDLSSDVQQDYSAALKQYTISGTIEETSTSDPVDDVLLDGFPGTVETDASGSYSVTLEHGWSGTVTPKKAGYSFEPYSRSYSNLDEEKDHDYTAYAGALARSNWPIFGGDPQHRSTASVEAAGDEANWTASVGGAASSPIIGSGGNIYVGSTDGSMYAFDTDGNQRWSTKALRRHEIQAAPAAASGQVFYIPFTDGTLSQYADDGTVDWSYRTDDSLFTAPVVSSGGVIYVGSDDDSLYAINPDGSKKWAYGTDDQVRSSPAIGSDGTIYVGSDDDSLYAITPGGSEKWTFGTGDNVRSSPAINTTNGTVYFGSDDDKVYAVDTSGTRNWEASTGGNVRSSPAIDRDGNIYVGSSDNSFYAFDSNGQQLWSYTTGGTITSSPAISALTEKVVYVGSSDGDVYAFDPDPGASKRVYWQYTTGGAVDASPALGEDGLYIGSDDEHLHALEMGTEAEGQLSSVAIDPRGILEEEVHLIVWLEEVGGVVPIEPPIEPDDPCRGGPLFIPDCRIEPSGFGASSPYVELPAEEELVIGVVGEGEIEAIASGETTEGLLGTVRTELTAGERSHLVIGGVTEPEAFAPNPEERSTMLNVFKNAYEKEPSSERVQLSTGHFVPDGSQMELALEGGDETETVGDLYYGETGESMELAPDRYEVTLTVENGSAGKQSGVETQKTWEIDLRERAGETVSLLAAGFVDPAANNDGPALHMQMVAADGQTTTVGEEETETSTRRTAEVPEEFYLGQNYPNPFNPTTSFEYALPKRTHVEVTVVNTLGQPVAQLVDEPQSPGRHTVKFDASGLPSGLYIYRLETPGFNSTRKMMLVK
jgi:outer membrane protein assembly factor BamB